MSTKKETGKGTETEKVAPVVAEDGNKDVTYDRSRSTHANITSQDHYRSTEKALEETKENIKRTIEKARLEIPRNVQAISDHQEQHLQATKEITDSYLDSQKEIINSFQSTWAPYLENTYNTFWDWTSPQRLAELYARTVSNFADNMITATRLANNAMITTMETFSTTIQQRKNDMKELNKIGANTARTFEQTSKSADEGTVIK